jgi:hypothetical protein
MEDVSVWLREHQGVSVEEQRLADPFRAASRIARLARDSAAALPFDTEPTVFQKLVDELAAGRRDG